MRRLSIQNFKRACENCGKILCWRRVKHERNGHCSTHHSSNDSSPNSNRTFRLVATKSILFTFINQFNRNENANGLKNQHQKYYYTSYRKPYNQKLTNNLRKSIWWIDMLHGRCGKALSSCWEKNLWLLWMCAFNTGHWPINRISRWMPRQRKLSTPAES